MQKYIKYAPNRALVYNLVEVQSEGCFFVHQLQNVLYEIEMLLLKKNAIPWNGKGLIDKITCWNVSEKEARQRGYSLSSIQPS